LLIVGGSLYVSSGFTNSTTVKSGNKIYRFDALTGEPRPGIGAAANTAEWSSGEPTTENALGRVTNGFEGLALGPDANNNGTQDIYAANLLGNTINVYEGGEVGSGRFIKAIVGGPNSDNLQLPTGIVIRQQGATAFFTWPVAATTPLSVTASCRATLLQPNRRIA
jgi:hypothetical protein